MLSLYSKNPFNMKSKKETPAFSQEEFPEEEEYLCPEDKKYGITKQELEKLHEEYLITMEALYRECDGDLLNWDILEGGVPIFEGGMYSIRNADIRNEKLYLDEEKQIRRYTCISKEEGSIRNDAIIYFKPNERLSEIITKLPFGLIDKQITGIGATYLELHSERSSIIVTPTRALALNKLKDEFLYVGSREGCQRATSKAEIKAYINNPEFEFKKILVVADSIDKVIEAIQENNEDVYRNYFLLVDEIDSLQSDNHFRPILSRVIDHYYKFKLQRRALLSATVREFTHPKLQVEALTTIQSTAPLKRNINLFYTNNINSLLAKKIVEISNEYPSDKILIAYNSVLNILQTVRLLPKELQTYETCSILCSEASKDEAGNYFRGLDNATNQLSCRINFMTCSYFAGVDIEDSYHLITVSNSVKVYSALPLNKIIQIYGRCRIPNGILSDTIIYNNSKKPLRNLRTYREYLSKKALKVIELLKAANTLKKGDKDLEDLFSRVHKAIIERATERLFEYQSFELVRESIDKELEISYFNIDALYEKMEAYHKLYSSKKGLYNHLMKLYPTINFYDVSDDEDDTIEEERDDIKEEVNQRLLIRLSNIKEELISVYQANALNNDYLNKKINSSKRKEEEFYKRVKAHYKYYDIVFLSNTLCAISLKNKKSYRNLSNALSFRALENAHPFKAQVFQNFKIGKKYLSKEIADLLSTIVKDQLFETLPQRTTSQSMLMNLFNSCVDSTYTGGKHLIKGYEPKYKVKDIDKVIYIEIPEPTRRIPKEEPAINHFEITHQSKSTNSTGTSIIFK